MLLETFWWRWNFQKGPHNAARFVPLQKCLQSVIIFSVHLSHLRVNWDVIDANDNRISKHLNFIFPLAKSPDLEESLFCSCWMLPTSLFCDICQSPDENEDFKTDFWDQNWRRFIPSCMYATSSHSRMCMCCCLTCVHVHAYATLTFAHVYAVASNSPICLCCSLAFAHMCVV